VIDATPPLAPENHGHFSRELEDPVGTELWLERLHTMVSSGDLK
jgi:vanillate/4-hydroxybenzoate decarboxylase subunit C